MHNIIPREITSIVKNRLENFPAVALLGARQAGKSTIARMIIQHLEKAIHLDLERPADLNKLTDPEAFFSQFSDHLICLDEIQRTPDIFPILRGVIDRNNRNGQFLILGSASRDLIRQSSESLAGRLSYIEVTPFTRREVVFLDQATHWLKGGFPRSLLTDTNDISFQWREDYIRTFLERDIPQLGFRIPANTIGRFWLMLAHSHGQVLNSSKLAGSMGVSAHTIRNYIDLLEQTFMLRVLAPYSGNVKKRLVKSPKVYIRDTGILHALLNIETMEDLFGHPIYGASYEGYVIENIATQLPRWQKYYFRTSNDAEIDLILNKGLKKIAIEIKAASNPKVTRSFWNCIESVSPDRTVVIAPVETPYPIASQVMVMPLDKFLDSLEGNPVSGKASLA
jgi:predicted AAA+ superfamily ATPase